MHHFFVNPRQIQEEQGEIIIQGTDVNHIQNVLRMKSGEQLLVSNGEGNDYMCKIKAFEENGVLLSIIDEVFEGTELKSKIYLFQGLPKGDKMELIIQKAVELGVYQIIPVATRRSVVKLDEKKAESKRKRWNVIAESAAKQSRRSIVPEVTRVMSFQEAIAYGKGFEYQLIPYENFKDMKSTKALLDTLDSQHAPEQIGIYIGPEGGFEEAEVEYSMEQGVTPVSLGKRILRTETAGLMLVSVLMYKLEE